MPPFSKRGGLASRSRYSGKNAVRASLRAPESIMSNVSRECSEKSRKRRERCGVEHVVEEKIDFAIVEERIRHWKSTLREIVPP